MTIILSTRNRFFKKIIGRFSGKFAVKWILKVPSHLAYVSTLPVLCETLMSAKQAFNNNLQDSIATDLRCGVLLTTKLKKRFIAESASEKK